MKQGIVLLLLVVPGIIFLSCNAPETKKQAVDSTNHFITATSARELDQRFLTADSLVFVFYKDPYMADSLRYTRYYSEYHSTDTIHIAQLSGNLELKFQKLEKPKGCRSEGKIWCFSKGNVFQTVYFSTRCNDCCFLYIIKDGYFFYMDIQAPFTTLLKELQLKATAINPDN